MMGVMAPVYRCGSCGKRCWVKIEERGLFGAIRLYFAMRRFWSGSIGHVDCQGGLTLRELRMRVQE